MKTKRILLLIIMFLFLINSIVLPYATVFATDTMSEEFKQILNEEGQLVVTDTTMLENKLELVRDYLSNYRTDEYYFMLNFYNEVDSTCVVSRINNTNGVPLEEYYDIPVVFEEKYSDEFKSILKDGKLEIRASTKNISGFWINNYIWRVGSEKYIDYDFKLAGYNASADPAIPDYRYLVTDDYTKATIVMTENSTGKIEQHVVDIKIITEQSENFKKYLNSDGKLQINGIKPSSEYEFMKLYRVLIGERYNIECSYVSEDDFSYCDLTVNNETHTVEIVYNYDDLIETKLQSLISSFPEYDYIYFKIEDMELINYWVNTIDNDDVSTLANYSGALKSYINNYNLESIFEPRSIVDNAFLTERFGDSVMTYNNIAYYATAYIVADAKHIIYVPDTTGDTKEELIAAAQKRINEYLGNDNIVSVSYAGTAERTYIEYDYEYHRWWEQEDPNMTLDEYIDKCYPTGIELNEEITKIENLNSDDDVFKATIKVGDKEKNYYIIIKKDTSKMITPTYSTVDILTGVEISSNSNKIPLDTHIKADKLTSGTEYDKIMSILDVEENVTYDLKLYSNSLRDYIIKLEDDTFEVKLPIPEELKGKTLTVYYVDENEKIIEYEVNSDNEEFAIFTTDHFSIYTLAEKIDTNIGDINGDGEINARDAKLAIQHFTGKIELTDQQISRADVNKDGEVNARDAKLIIQHFTGKIDLNDSKEYLEGYEIAGKIEIPKTNINLPVLLEASVGALNYSVGILDGVGLNNAGNTTIIGHNYSDDTFFSNNDQLEIGDTIYIIDKSNKKIAYEIYQISELEASDVSYMLRDTNGAREITLSTVASDINYRLIIFAKEKQEIDEN